MDLVLVSLKFRCVDYSQYIELLDHLIKIAADTPDLEDQGHIIRIRGALIFAPRSTILQNFSLGIFAFFTLSFSDRHSSSVKRMTTALFLLLIDLYTSCFHKNSARLGRIRGLRVLPEMCFLISKSIACFLGLHP